MDVLIWNDYGPFAELNTSISGGFPANYYIKFGATPNCPTNFVYPCQNNAVPDCVRSMPQNCNANPLQKSPGYTSSWDFGRTTPFNPPGFTIVNIPLTINPSWQTCKESSNPVNCGFPYQPVKPIQGRAYWGWDNYAINPWVQSIPSAQKTANGQYQLTDADIAGANCPADRMNCPSPPQDSCSIGPCPNRCNKFTILQVKTVSGATTVRVNVTNQCADAFYYAAFSVNTTGTTASISYTAPTSTYTGPNYGYTVSVLDIKLDPNVANSPVVHWIRFVASGGQNPSFSNKTSKNWDVFQFTMTGWDLGLPLIFQGHEGGLWDTYNSVDASTCLCTDCDTTNNNSCPDGFTGNNCTQCDKNPLPGGYTWFCSPTGNNADPWALHKIPNRILGTGQWTVPPGFIPSNGSGLSVDANGYLVNCDCSEVHYDCSPLNYCNGHGTCVPQNGTCVCETGYLGPDCRPPTTTPAITTTPAGTTTSPAPTTTLPGETFTSPPPTTTPATTNPPCYNNGRFCTGHGVCDGTKCVCAANYTGADCSVQIVTTTQHFCSEATTCTNCTALNAAYNLDCSWCGDVVGGGCVLTAACSTVRGCNGSSVSFVAEPCPDQCSGNNGVCVNETCSALQAAGKTVPKVNGVPACIPDGAVQYDNTTNQTIVTNSTISYCLCKKGYKGNNCGSRSSGLAKALAISGGVIAAIVICGVIILVVVAFGAKKTVDFVMLNQQAAADFKINPTHHARDTEHVNALHT